MNKTKTYGMRYTGKLYGKIGGKYFETGKTAADWDALEAKANLLPELIEALKTGLQAVDIIDDYEELEIDREMRSRLDVYDIIKGAIKKAMEAQNA